MFKRKKEEEQEEEPYTKKPCALCKKLKLTVKDPQHTNWEQWNCDGCEALEIHERAEVLIGPVPEEYEDQPKIGSVITTITDSGYSYENLSVVGYATMKKDKKVLLLTTGGLLLDGELFTGKGELENLHTLESVTHGIQRVYKLHY